MSYNVHLGVLTEHLRKSWQIAAQSPRTTFQRRRTRCPRSRRQLWLPAWLSQCCAACSCYFLPIDDGVQHITRLYERPRGNALVDAITSDMFWRFDWTLPLSATAHTRR